MTLFACSRTKPAAPQIHKLPQFASHHVDARNIEVFLPRQYFELPRQRFNVLYIHDGQNVFDPGTAYGGVAWELDSAVQAMLDANQIRPTIVVAIWNNGMKRYNEYCPEKPFMQLSPTVRDSIDDEYRLEGNMLADEYLRFLVDEVKPFIDQHYRTESTVDHTFIMGSSMGGLISAYALLEYPEIFGGAACLSTHWPFSHQKGPHPFANVMIDYVVERYATIKDKHLLYFDLGTNTLDSLYPEHQARLDSVILSKYGEQPNYVSKRFDGHAHNEASWKARIDVPLSFLLQ
jgi:enterochelin esterase-like enzyme